MHTASRGMRGGQHWQAEGISATLPGGNQQLALSCTAAAAAAHPGGHATHRLQMSFSVFATEPRSYAGMM